MPAIHIRRPWEMSGRLATPESVYVGRRRFLKTAGLSGLALVAGACSDRPAAARGTGATGQSPASSAAAPSQAGDRSPLYPAARNPAYTLDRDLTPEPVASNTINYYEFSTDKSAVTELSADLVTEPWTVEVTGLVKKPRTWGVDEILRVHSLEERLYRHRCVEAWAMAVPWTGLPLARFVAACEPLAAARFVRFTSFNRPAEAVGQRVQSWYPWPYTEGLSLEEATNELALLTTGIYGHPLPNQHGAPLRIVLPWKYGYKSIKGIVKIEFVASRPATFWNTVEPAEYDFVSNVDPGIPHPRWSQATERLLGTGERVPTQIYNGYGEQVAHLYA
ncbi:MAG: protein-methionine-sulfoxide reductase catalytic subunit MsrP [Acidobacteriota bacterium]